MCIRDRLLAVAGDPQAWADCSRVARERARESGVDLPTAHLLWQTILGVGDIDHDRMATYVRKALREAKQHTAWVDGDEDYERRVIDFVDEMRKDGRLHDEIDQALARNAEAVRATILAAKTVQLTMPGVPDCYQGCEVVDLSLVDPDNRRPVDYDRRSALLAALRAQGIAAVPPERRLDAEKLLVTSTIMGLRRDEPELFAGPYLSLIHI